MIPYELIIPSAARPHLLQRTLGTLLANVDQFPAYIRIHNDERFPGRREAIDDVVRSIVPRDIPVSVEHDDPPIRHGPALGRLLGSVRTEYVLYSQDDHRVIRQLPIRAALMTLDEWNLNQIRFNKRDTMDKKGREGQEFHKVEKFYEIPTEPPGGHGDTVVVPLCVADHWYFQTGVWRVAAIRPVVDWWIAEGPGAFSEHCEVKINDVFNGKFRHLKTFPAPVPVCSPEQWNDPEVRNAVHKTFIWGRVGEPRFVDHIGTDPADWALERANRDPGAPQV